MHASNSNGNSIELRFSFSAPAKPAASKIPYFTFSALVQHNDLAGVKEFLKVNQLISHTTNSAFPVPCDSCVVNNLCHKTSGDFAGHIAARLGHLDLLRYLIEEQGGNIELANRDGKTMLHDAAQFTQFHVVEYLIGRGANVNAVKKADWTPLMLACTRQEARIVQILLLHGADPHFKNKDGWNSLHIAVREGNLEIVTNILTYSDSDQVPEKKLELCQSKSKNGRSLLHTAVMHGHEAVTSLLLTQEPPLFDINDGDHCGTTPVMDAARFGFNSLLELLVDQFHADLGKLNKLGMNCLHVAAEAGQAETIALLVRKYGMDVNLQAPSGLTPLHWTVKEDHVDAAKVLLDLGASLTMLDNKGWTCLDMGRNLKKIKVCQFLESIN